MTRTVILSAALSLGGAAFYLFLGGGLGWWGDGIALGLLGMLVGQWAGFSVMAYFPRWAHSDGPTVLGNAVGLSGMVPLWLCLPESTVKVLGHIARGLVGGAVGLLVACFLAMESQGYTPKLEDSRMGEPSAAPDRPHD
jgi:hypothetical protein